MTDSKYFTTTKKGEIFELKSELNNDKKEKKKEAVKKVIIETISYTQRPLWTTIYIDDVTQRLVSLTHKKFIRVCLNKWILRTILMHEFVFTSIRRSLPAWPLAKMCRHCSRTWSIVCKPIIWNWKNWSICIWWIMQSLSQTWPLWLSTHSLRLVAINPIFYIGNSFLSSSFITFHKFNLGFLSYGTQFLS